MQGRIKFISVLFILMMMGAKSMALNYYWVGGTGNWSDYTHHWATSSGGTVFYNQIPQTVDNVFFDQNSFDSANQTVTIDRTIITCANMDWTGSLHAPTLAGDIYTSLHIYGSLTFTPDMHFAYIGITYFDASATGKTLKTYGQFFRNSIFFQGVNGGWTLMDSLNAQGISHLRGTLSTNNQLVNVGHFDSDSANIRTLDLGSSVINCSNGWTATSNSLTLLAGTSTINMTNSDAQFRSDGTLTYYDVNFSNTGTTPNQLTPQFRWTGNNIFHNVSFAGSAYIAGNNQYQNLILAPGMTYLFAAASIQTINNNFNAVGNCSGYINISTDVIGTYATIVNAGASNFITSYNIIRDIKITGINGGIANNSVDLGNNPGWVLNVLSSRNLYWIGGTGNWHDPAHWSLTSGGPGGACMPGPGDNVFFDAHSFDATGEIVSIDILNANCKSMDWTGALHTPEMNGATANSLHVYGSLTLIHSMRNSFTGVFYFESPSLNQTITSGNHPFFNDLVFQGAGGGWTLLDNVSAKTLSLIRGNLNTNGQRISLAHFDTYYTNTRVLTLSNSIINCSLGWQMNSLNLTFDAGTSVINLTGNGIQLKTSGPTNFYDVNFTSTSTSPNIHYPQIFWTGTNHFHNVVFSGGAYITGLNFFNNLVFSAGQSYLLATGSKQTITGAFTAIGTCSAIINITSDHAGSLAELDATHGSVMTDYTSIMDIKVDTGAVFSATNSINMGNNPGWIFSPAVHNNIYWVGGSGNWGDQSHWSTTSGGPGGTCMPTSYDNVFFDANSFSDTAQVVVINQNSVSCLNMDWTGAKFTPTLAGPYNNALHIYGSLVLNPNMHMNFMGLTTFDADTTGNTITSYGQTFMNAVSFQGFGGSWSINDDFSASNMILTRGTFYTNNHVLNVGHFDAYNSNPRAIYLGSSVVNCSDVWSMSSSNMIFDAGTSTINMRSGLPQLKTFGLTRFYDVNFTSYNVTINLHLPQILWTGTNFFHNVTFNGNAYITGNNVFNDLTFTPGKTYILQAGTTQKINGNFNSMGKGGFPIRIQSDIADSAATINKAIGVVCLDFLRISDNIATGGARFFAGINSENIRGNGGWIFSTTAAPIHMPDYNRCNNELVFVKGPDSGFVHYSWAPAYNINHTDSASVTIWPDHDTSYTLTAINNDGCQTIDTINVHVFNTPPVHLGNDTSFCANSQLLLDAGNGYTGYLWQDQSTGQTLLVNQAGQYWVEATDSNHCKVRDSLQVLNVYPMPVVHLGADANVCESRIMLLDASTPGASYEWQDGSSDAQYMVRKAGTYSVKVTKNGCSSTDSIHVNYIMIPHINLDASRVICLGEKVLLNPAIDSLWQLKWQDGSSNPTYTVTNPGTYSLLATNNCGSDYAEIMLTEGNCHVAVPNAFSPNGDNHNDIFRVYGTDGMSDFRLVIYNRYGQMIFETTDKNAGWNGKFNQQDCPGGTYMYMLQYREWDKADLSIAKGTLVLVR